MCLAVPVRLKEKKSAALGVIEYGGVLRDVNLMLLENISEGDYILVHAGFAIQRLDEAEAEETLKLMRQMAFLKMQDEEGTQDTPAPQGPAPQ
jgi:hydrogenase expression/formation protein HypC